MLRFKERREKRREEIILNDCLFVLPRVCAGIKQRESTEVEKTLLENDIHEYEPANRLCHGKNHRQQVSVRKAVYVITKMIFI